MFKKNRLDYNSIKKKSNGDIVDNLLKKEETYWVGASIPAILFAGFIDAGITIGLLYGAKKLYERKNG